MDYIWTIEHNNQVILVGWFNHNFNTKCFPNLSWRPPTTIHKTHLISSVAETATSELDVFNKVDMQTVQLWVPLGQVWEAQLFANGNLALSESELQIFC